MPSGGKSTQLDQVRDAQLRADVRFTTSPVGLGIAPDAAALRTVEQSDRFFGEQLTGEDTGQVRVGVADGVDAVAQVHLGHHPQSAGAFPRQLLSAQAVKDGGATVEACGLGGAEEGGRVDGAVTRRAGVGVVEAVAGVVAGTDTTPVEGGVGGLVAGDHDATASCRCAQEQNACGLPGWDEPAVKIRYQPLGTGGMPSPVKPRMKAP